jgi:hypothetical protein
VDASTRRQGGWKCPGNRLSLISILDGGDPMTELRDKARALGLDRLTDEQLGQLQRALDTMAGHVRRLPRDLPPAQEMALIFRAKPAP